ncbi:MAG: hypothetical protein RMX68_025020 [Aulosira sp. ZfuVER01]|nr:hypothetical protein [Aulosira sp. ZfuVER01]MDZ7999424.1 hypothetical protein [Aulosira sp. DedVER01a]MDZ8055391.1 hypothetical protein [Aulosira sp. ZfuCHP01]
MPTKTDRILSYLPGTFQVLPRAIVLYAVADAFGKELLQAENSLAEVMSAHWVDKADRGAEVIKDLELLAALYGLKPRKDDDGNVLETVEEFRTHLKRYVRTFLEGTVTIQGILQVTAEALGLQIADDYQNLDSWWNRQPQELVTFAPREDDATTLILGVKQAQVVGRAAQPAQIKGSIKLNSGVNLQDANRLQIKVDSHNPVTIDLVEGVADPTSVSLNHIKDRINASLNAIVASSEDGYLTLTSPTKGTTSLLEIQEITNDAAQTILGISPRTYRGSEATAAQVTGTVDLNSEISLSQERYLRLLIDGSNLAEIDLTGGNSTPITLNQIRDAINNSLTINVASHNDRFLTLTSPTSGASSSIVFQQPAAQDAKTKLFGNVLSFYTGQNAQPACIVGKRELTQGVDLSDRASIRLQIDNQATVTINCAGENPANTQGFEIVTKINQAVGREVASYNGKFVSLTSPTVGANVQIVLEIAPTGDASEDIFGIVPRTVRGEAATTARIVGTPQLETLPESQPGVDLRAEHRLQIAVDSKAPVEINLRSHAANLRLVTLAELQNAINAVLPNVVSNDGTRLIFTSPTIGNVSSIAIAPLEKILHRRHVTRAAILNEATQAVFGFIHRHAQGTPATKAQVIGERDLSRGVDLQTQRFLRISIDGQPPQEIDFATNPRIARPRAATLPEIIAAINEKLGTEVASDNGKQLILTSANKIEFFPPQGADARSLLLGVEPGTFRGQDATRITFIGTVDLSNGINLAANAKIKLALDGGTAAEITIGEAEAGTKSLSEIVSKINQSLGKVFASHDGKHLILTSEKQGDVSRIEFASPTDNDATNAIFGITPPRSYQGINAIPAQIIGTTDLSPGVDLRVARFLKLTIEGKTVEIDCAAGIANPANVRIDDIVRLINNAIAPATATHDNTHLIITTSTTGTASRIDLLSYTQGDARDILIGNVPDVTNGSPPLPAAIASEVDLLTPVNLSDRQLIRLSVDGNRPLDINISGVFPEQTFLSEIVAKINAVVPGLASASESDRLQLTSPTAGENSQLTVLPLRYLELIEYPPEKQPTTAYLLKHGDRLSVVHQGKEAEFAKITITALDGVVGPTLVNEARGWQIRLFTVLSVRDKAELWRDPNLGVQVKIIESSGTTRTVSGREILVGPIGAQTWIPFAETKNLSNDNIPTLQLNNPFAPNIVLLRAANRPGIIGNQITVSVREAAIPAVSERLGGFIGQIRVAEGAYRLLGQNQQLIAQLQPGGNIDLASYVNSIVVIRGIQSQDEPLIIVQEIAHLFDVTLRFQPATGQLIEETYKIVTIGVSSSDEYSLVRQINISNSAQLVKVEELDKATVLSISPGKSEWVYLDCYGSRFDRANFNSSYFPDGVCCERGVFNISRFVSEPPDLVNAVFTASDTLPDPGVEVVFDWVSHRSGAFIVNLPADLQDAFGGKFNEARFSQGKDEPELYPQAVTEPATDAYSLVKLINEGNPNHETPILPSNLVAAQEVAVAPLGWQPITIPFRKPQFLTLGRNVSPEIAAIDSPGKDGFARIYLAEDGFNNLIELKAKVSGAWGNKIAVSVRKAGPAMYDVSIIYNDSRFENARAVVLGGEELPALTAEILQPGAIGILQAKAAGVKAKVTRDRCGEE